MSKKQQKEAIEDNRGNTILVETIAGFQKTEYKGMKIFLRSGDKINMYWDSGKAAKSVRNYLKSRLNIHNGAENV